MLGIKQEVNPTGSKTRVNKLKVKQKSTNREIKKINKYKNENKTRVQNTTGVNKLASKQE